jgi:hypothetical protein
MWAFHAAVRGRGKQGWNGYSLFVIQNRMKNEAIPSFSKGR